MSRDSAFLVTAYAVNVLTLFLFPTTQRDAYVLVEAIGFTFACAIPALLARLLLKRGGYHGWTLGFAAAAAFGNWYGYTH